MAGIPLAPEDRAILALEGPTVVGHTIEVVGLGAEAPSLDALRARIADRIALAPALTRVLRGTPEAPGWEPDERFAVEAHVVDHPAVEREELPGVVAGLFAQRLDRALPLWSIARVGLPDGEAALVWRIHHALADGTTGMRFARALLWDAAAEPPPPASHEDARRRGHLAAFLQREFARAPDPSPFDGAIGTRREVAFARASLPALHDAARRLDGATVNDAVLTVVSGGIWRWLEAHDGRLGAVRIRIPVSLHREGDDVANRDSFFCVPVELGEKDPVARLRAIHAATRARKHEDDALRMDTLLEGLRGASPALRRLAGRMEDSPRRFALAVSNVPGPREPVSVLGAPAASLHAVCEIGERHGLRVTATSLADGLFFGFCVDPELVPDPRAMAAGLEESAAALIAAAA